MPSQPSSSFANLDLTSRGLCGGVLDACRSGDSLHKPSLTHDSSEVQNKNPFVDEYALRDSGIEQNIIGTTQKDIKTTMISRSLSLPFSDDGLPDSIPSRHTVSVNSPGSSNRHAAPFSAGSRRRPPPLPLSPRSITSQRTLSNPFQMSIPAHGADLVTPRESPQRQTTFVDAAVGDRSETASIHSAGEPTKFIRENQRSAGTPKLVPTKLPNDNAVRTRTRTRSSVSGQKQPFPLLSPILGQASEWSALAGKEKENQSHERIMRGTQMIKQMSCLRTGKWGSKRDWIDPSLKVVFMISVITLTAALVAGVKDAKVNVLEASTVIAGIIGIVGCAASVLCAWAISIGRQRRNNVNELHPKEDICPEENIRAVNEKQDKVSQYSKQIRPNLGHFSMASGKRKQKTEDVERSPRFKPKYPIDFPLFAFPLQGQRPVNSAQASEFGHRLSIPQPTHSSSSGIPPPSSEALPAASTRRHSAPSSRSEADKSYRELLELRLANRDIWDVLDEAAGIDEVYWEQQTPNSAPRNQPQMQTAHGITDKLPQALQIKSQILHTRNNDTCTRQPIISVPTRSPSSVPSIFLRKAATSPNHQTRSPSGQSELSSSYLPLSQMGSLEPSIDQKLPTSVAHPSPVYQQSDEGMSADSIAKSDTSALMELRTMRSVQKVRLWQKFMLDGVEHIREVEMWEHGKGPH